MLPCVGVVCYRSYFSNFRERKFMITEEERENKEKELECKEGDGQNLMNNISSLHPKLKVMKYVFGFYCYCLLQLCCCVVVVCVYVLLLLLLLLQVMVLFVVGLSVVPKLCKVALIYF